MPLYGRINQSRIRMILEALEEALRSDKAETPEAPRNLQLEHVMPRKWQTHWPLVPNADPEAHHRAVDRRSRLIDTLGNLTLLHGKLNAAISNGPWENKRAAVAEHSTLFLNKALLDDHASSAFDDAAIEARGRALGHRACAVWPRPASVG